MSLSSQSAYQAFPQGASLMASVSCQQCVPHSTSVLTAPLVLCVDTMAEGQWRSMPRSSLSYPVQPSATVGHSHKGWLRAVEEQAGQLCHASNLFHTAPQARLAKLLVENTPWADRVFYSNSGTEAVEAVIKFARKFARVQGVHVPSTHSPSWHVHVRVFMPSFPLCIILTCDASGA